MGPQEDRAARLAVLDPATAEHLRQLTRHWGMLADLCFSDLLLCAPASKDRFSGRFVVLDQVRPATAQTRLTDDQVGRLLHAWEATLVARAWSSGEAQAGELRGETLATTLRVYAIPVRLGQRTVGALLRYSAPVAPRRPGELERTYLRLFERFSRMISEGSFPFAPGEWSEGDTPRVGDGVIVLAADWRVQFASPNAVTALHRLGVGGTVGGISAGDLGLFRRAVESAISSKKPAVAEAEGENGTVVAARCLPLLAGGEVDGVLMLVRDATELRSRDRMLMSKDATIREIHHRVKNNLQTISSLLRLQARRIGEGRGRTALAEAERRIRSIAVVHDFLSRDVGDEVGFDQIVSTLVRMAADSVLPPKQVTFSVSGRSGTLPAGVATPLAVVVSELLQNAVEHAFDAAPGHVRVSMVRNAATVAGDLAGAVGQGGEGTLAEAAGGRWGRQKDRENGELVITVSDDGRGLPEDFSIDSTRSLGLTIVRDLVEGQLQGTLSLRSGHGLEAVISVPDLPRDEEP